MKLIKVLIAVLFALWCMFAIAASGLGATLIVRHFTHSAAAQFAAVMWVSAVSLGGVLSTLSWVKKGMSFAGHLTPGPFTLVITLPFVVAIAAAFTLLFS